jgi:UDP-glucose 4-epimerase
MMEMILKDFCIAYGMRGISLRYFNPIGADPQMRSGIHVQFPSHVLGKLVDVAIGNEKVFKITGVNWNTRDGSGIRDFVHVWDLALAHVKAVEKFEEAFDDSSVRDNYVVINLGTGEGVTIKELVKAFESVYGKEINKDEASSRPGDVAGSYASIDKAKKILSWQPTMSIEKGIEDALKWAEKRESIIRF